MSLRELGNWCYLSFLSPQVASEIGHPLHLMSAVSLYLCRKFPIPPLRKETFFMGTSTLGVPHNTGHVESKQWLFDLLRWKMVFTKIGDPNVDS